MTGCLPDVWAGITSNDLGETGLPFCGTAPPPIATPPATSTPTDQAALVALYNATNGHSWKDNTNWLNDRPTGEWHGVTTDGSGRVTELCLSGNRLEGGIPLELFSLANLEELYLSYNQLTGSIPLELGDLADLEELFPSLNQLKGSIPPKLGRFIELKWLDLQGNQLTGASRGIGRPVQR